MESVASASEDFRSVVVSGANVASYECALAKSTLSLAESGVTSFYIKAVFRPMQLLKASIHGPHVVDHRGFPDNTAGQPHGCGCLGVAFGFDG
jgi:hypothetical protein